MDLVSMKVRLMRNRIAEVLTTLYDYEYIDLEKFYNDNYNAQLLEEFESGNDEYNEEILEQLQSFLDFETNYNAKLGDF